MPSIVEWQECLNGIVRTTTKLNYFVTTTDQQRNVVDGSGNMKRNCSHPASLHPTQVAMSQRVPPVRLKLLSSSELFFFSSSSSLFFSLLLFSSSLFSLLSSLFSLLLLCHFSSKLISLSSFSFLSSLSSHDLFDIGNFV